MLPLHVFWHLYPDQISPAGLPTGLNHISTRLTTYNGSHIPLYGALHRPITWQPDCPGSQPHRVNSYWYVADTPGPAILGLPSSEKLAVMKMNCAIMVGWPSTHPAPVSTTAATTRPATAPEAAKSIRSTDDLIKEFPDQFKGISRFPGKYKIRLCHDAHPMIHAPRKCPFTLCPKVKEHLNKMECLGVITLVDEPTDWVSSVTYIQKANGKLHLCLDPRDLNEAFCCEPHKIPTVEEVAHEFAHSHFFTKLDTYHGYWSIVLDQDSSLLMTFNSPFWKIPFPATSLWPGLFPRHLPEKDGSDPQRVPRMYWNCRWHHHTWLHQGGTWSLPTRPYAYHLQIWLGVQPTENTCEDPSCQLFWLPLQCQQCPPRPGQGQCC